MSDLAGIVNDRLRPPLASETALRDLRRLWDFTGELTPHYGFEVRLGGKCEDIDLGFLVDLESISSVIRFSEENGTASGWRRIGAFARRWHSDASLRVRVPHFWLELDRSAGSEKQPVPSLFFALDRAVNDPSPHPDVETAAEVLGLVAAEGPSSEALDAIDRCTQQLGRFGHALHLGALIGRTPSATRLSVGLPTSEATPYLERIEWPGDLAEVAAMLRALAPVVRDVQLDFDVGRSVGERVGIGIRVPESRWEAVLLHVAGAGAASPTHAKALLDWAGVSQTPALQLYLSHIKLDLGVGAGSAKGYLGVLSKHGNERRS